MEFKKRLKDLRGEKGISQQSLANSIFVSRSAIAKWESGLGLPSEDSYIALSEFFGVSIEELKADEGELIVVENNRRKHKIFLALEFAFMTFLILISALIVFSVFSNSYGLTSKMAVGSVFADKPCYDFDDYDIYYDTMDFVVNGDGEDRVYPAIYAFKPVKRLFVGYGVFREDYKYRCVYSGGEAVGILYSIEGDDCYYNIFRATIHQNIESLDWFTFDSVKVNGETYTAEHYSFFITEKRPVGEMVIGNSVAVIDEEYKLR